jgi:hypothetical protein
MGWGDAVWWLSDAVGFWFFLNLYDIGCHFSHIKLSVNTALPSVPWFCSYCMPFLLSVPAKVLSVRNSTVKVEVSKLAELACSIEGYPVENFDWKKLDGGFEK